MKAAPARPQSRDATIRFVAAISVALVLYNSTAQLIPAYAAAYVPLNLAAASVLLTIATRWGLGREEMGLTRRYLGRGLILGIMVAGVVGLVLLATVLISPLRPLLDDARVAGIGPGLVAYRTVVRIPLGTALFEELAFRGVLFGAWTRLTSPLRASAGSSVVFGLWHIRPTIDLLDANALADGVAVRFGLVVASVVLTAAAGYLFCLLRIHARSLAAPFLAHAAINSLAILAAYAVAG